MTTHQGEKTEEGSLDKLKMGSKQEENKEQTRGKQRYRTRITKRTKKITPQSSEYTIKQIYNKKNLKYIKNEGAR